MCGGHAHPPLPHVHPPLPHMHIPPSIHAHPFLPHMYALPFHTCTPHTHPPLLHTYTVLSYIVSRLPYFIWVMFLVTLVTIGFQVAELYRVRNPQGSIRFGPRYMWPVDLIFVVFTLTELILKVQRPTPLIPIPLLVSFPFRSFSHFLFASCSHSTNTCPSSYFPRFLLMASS